MRNQSTSHGGEETICGMAQSACVWLALVELNPAVADCQGAQAVIDQDTVSNCTAYHC